MALASPASPAIQSEIEQYGDLVRRVSDELHKVVVGQQKMINRLLIGLFCNGHVLLEGVPGLAKTLTISSLAQALKLSFKRIQFTPDLLPGDVVGTMVFNPREAKFEVKKGPIFANIILADEINRSPAKVQSALLEAMQEKQVTLGEQTFALDRPFLVLATQNPVDQEGTYPLPEAQVDRFMMRIFVDYPTPEEELLIMRRMARTQQDTQVQAVLDGEQILHIRRLIDQVELAERIEQYIVNLVLATRKPAEAGLPKLSSYLQYGASPRATIAMSLGARCMAFLNGRSYVLPEDVKEVAPDVLNHRLILTYEAEAEEVTSLQIIDQLLKTVAI